MQLTILFDGQYWIGIIEQIENQNLFACKHLFGSSPSDIEVMEFVNQNLISLIRNKKTSITLEKELTIPSNPKKRAREASKAVKKTSISTHAQEVLRLEQESKKKESDLD